MRALALPFEAEPARTVLLAAHPRVGEALFDDVARALGATVRERLAGEPPPFSPPGGRARDADVR